MRWRLPGATGFAFAALLLPIGARADLPLPDGGTLDLELLAPSSGEQIRRLVPLALVKGRVSSPELFDSDVVIAIDQSNSALLASGLDVDGDGLVGRTRSWAKHGGGYGKPHRGWTSDHGDTVLAAELSAVGALIGGLAARGNRIGLLTYTDAVRVRANVGEPAAALSALRKIRPIVDWTGTNHARALAISEDLLASAGPGPEALRPRAILLLSDGRPTAPDGPHWATKRALEGARELSERGVAVFTASFGEEPDPEYLGRLASASGGSLLSPEDLHVLASESGRRRLEPQELVIENLTARDAARAVRTFPDGSFDGIVSLADGENVLEVRAVFADGRRASVRGVVHYERPDPATEADRRDAARWLLLLRERTREIGGSRRRPEGARRGPQPSEADRASARDLRASASRRGRRGCTPRP